MKNDRVLVRNVEITGGEGWVVSKKVEVPWHSLSLPLVMAS